MAIKLTKKEISQQSELAGNMRQAIEDFQAEQEKAETWIEANAGELLEPAIKEGLNVAAAKLLVAIEEAENFRAEIAERLRDEYDEKSEKWQEGDKGSEADSFINEWESAEFETLDISEDLVSISINDSMPDDLEALPELPE